MIFQSRGLDQCQERVVYFISTVLRGIDQETWMAELEKILIKYHPKNE